MLENDLNQRPERHPLISLILILITVGIGFILIGPTLGAVIVSPFYAGGLDALFTAIQDTESHPEVKLPLYIIQGFATFIGLILAPAFYMARIAYSRTSVVDFFRHHKTGLIPVLITLLVVIIFMAVNSVFVEWNAGFSFPEFVPQVIKDFEQWARVKETVAADLTEFLTKFNSPGELAIAIVVIAVLPAIGEEIVFRGLIQNELFKATRNAHLSIWLAAVLFSAIHLQFFGFLPRLLLGALFGYLYYWSGNLALAIVAHFVNNGASVLALYFYQQGAFQYDMESTESAPASVVITSALLTAGLLYYFYRYFQHRKPAIPQS